jgi:hypothetical protein
MGVAAEHIKVSIQLDADFDAKHTDRSMTCRRRQGVSWLAKEYSENGRLRKRMMKSVLEVIG